MKRKVYQPPRMHVETLGLQTAMLTASTRIQRVDNGSNEPYGNAFDLDDENINRGQSTYGDVQDMF